MATIESRQVIAELLSSPNGEYRGDPSPAAVCVYKHSITHKQLFAVYYREQDNDLEGNPFAFAVTYLMTHGVLTVAGKQWLDRNTANGGLQ